MACLEIECTRCGWHTFTNTTLLTCPECGAETTIEFDESGDQDEAED